MQIFVKILTGATETLEVEPSTTLQKIKEELGTRLCFSPDEIRLIFAGKQLDTDISTRTEDVVVVEGNSRSEHGVHRINIDQPLLLFYHQVLNITDAPNLTSESGIFAEESACIGGVRMKFNRTVRVPDNHKIHSLPPGLGCFKLFNAGQAAQNLPPAILHKGGVFLSMYQREAMWMSFEGTSFSYAVKVSVGGINALTGLPQNQSVEGIQDYVVVGGDNGQKWLDGISTAPNVVRQFVAMPLGNHYTVEGQVTGKEDTEGIQIDVFPRYGLCHFGQKYGNRHLNCYKTPRQLGLQHGDIIDLYSPATTLKDYNIQKESTIHMTLRLRGGGGESVVTPASMLTLGVAAGGRISQKIIRDPLPVFAYNPNGVKRLHIAVINAAYFTQVTGLPSPPSPISPQTYLRHRLPWYSLYDEMIPTANNVMASSPLANVKSIGQMMHGTPASNRIESCGYCSYQLATLHLSPCGHPFCDDCANTPLCPSCGGSVAQRVRFAAPMAAPGQEDDDGVEDGSIDKRIIKLQFAAPVAPGQEDDDGADDGSLDERIVKLQAGARAHKVLSFRSKAHAVAELSGSPDLERSR